MANRAGAGTINDDCTSWIEMKGVQLEGAIEPVDDLAELTRAATLYLRRFPFSAALWHGVMDPEQIARAPGVHGFFRLTPARLFFMDNEHAPGGREELPLGERAAPTAGA